MSDLRQHMADYIALRHAVGFKLRGYDRLLADFADFVDASGNDAVTAQQAVAWATRPQDVQPIRWKQRLSVVRGFARHLHAMDESVEVPASDLLAYRRDRPTPFLYTEAEIVALLEAAAVLRPQLRADTHRTLFGLLAVTGMRVGEAIRLDRSDVDTKIGQLTIRHTKFNKARRLPLHSSAVAELESYADKRDRSGRRPTTSRFFISTRGTPLLDTCVHGVFRQLADRACHLEPRLGSGPPRVHDLRHSFAVATMTEWYRDGLDVTAHLPLLSAYLGHVDPVSTYWYLQAAPLLLTSAAQRLEDPTAGSL